MVIKASEQITLKTIDMEDDIVEISSVEEDEEYEEDEEDEDDEEEEGDGLQYKDGCPHPYEGQVKTLVKMYENFAKNMVITETKAAREHNTSQTVTTAGPSSSAGEATAAVVMSPEKTEPFLERRLQCLEGAMSATVNFVTDLVNLKLDILDTTIKHQVSMEKNFKVLQTKTNDLDEEMDVYQDHEHFIGGAVTTLRKDYGTMLLRISKLEQTFSNIQTDIQNVSREVYKTGDMVSELVKTLKSCQCPKDLEK